MRFAASADARRDLWYNTGMKVHLRRGQAALEYVLAFCALALVVGVLWHLVGAAKWSVIRTEALVSSDYP